MAVRTVALRPALASDEPFLRRVFTDARRSEFPGVPAADLEPLLALQYRAHSADRASRHPHAEVAIITDDSEPVGSVTVDRSDGRLHLVDIAVLADHRSRGVATAVLEDLLASAEHVTLTVWALNTAARRLYERHGFSVVAEQFGYVLMATEAAA
ncbi:N-acetyltransferase [Leifsonia sp. F6_8S_P_1B]|uniref:N-acetyltransferase n=1 Tax=Leifsonia williamsii TaxID=3035919 RepID=A0ABT8K6Q8_9MICO|nr:N-acetyltransferase [Leifsonia williamsii]MDN4613101.1 N-acetyltransferase [Leifsonia williamsii]